MWRCPLISVCTHAWYTCDCNRPSVLCKPLTSHFKILELLLWAAAFPQLWQLIHEQDLASSLSPQDHDKKRIKYILDSCIARLILDGELRDHCPSSLVSYRLDLQAALFGGDECRKLSDLPTLTNYLHRAVSVYNWAKEAGGGHWHAVYNTNSTKWTGSHYLARSKYNAIASGPEIMVITDNHAFLWSVRAACREFKEWRQCLV